MLAGLVAASILAAPAPASAIEPSDMRVGVNVSSGHGYRTSVWVQLVARKPCNYDGTTVVKFTNAGRSTDNKTHRKCDRIGLFERESTPDWGQEESLGGSQFNPDFDGPGSYGVRLSVKFKGKTLVSGRFTVVVKRIRERERIYENQDAFVNYCINHNAEIRSHNGRLYCVRPGAVRQRIRDVRLHRNVPSFP